MAATGTTGGRAALTPRTVGTLLCLVSAASYGAAAIFGKLAFDEGLTVSGLLAGRFVIAAAVLWAMVAVLGPGQRPTRRAAAGGFTIGLVVYATQSGFFFASLERLDASLTVLLVYVAPAVVAGLAVLTGRERLTRAQLLALPVALGGTALVLAGAGVGTVDALGVAFAFGCAVTYALYVLVSDAAVRRTGAVALAAAVCTGCAVAFVAVAAARGELPVGAGGHAWFLIACLAVVSTVVSISTLAAGSARVGPSSAAILSTFEPVVTAALAFVWFDERLGAVQVVGALLVLASVAILHGRQHRAPAGDAAAAP